MSKEDVLITGIYGMRGEGKSYFEKLKDKDKEIENLKQEIKELKEETEKLTQEWLKSQEKRRKAIEYMKIFVDFDECLINGKNFQKAIDILDKENK